MKRILTLIVGVTMSSMLFGQVNCYVKINLENDTLIKAEEVKLGKKKGTDKIGGYALEAHMYVYKLQKTISTFALILKPHFENLQTLYEGDDVLIYFTDGSILALTVRNTNISEHPGDDWNNFLTFIIRDKELEQLESKSIEKVRCGINDYAVKKSDADTLKEMIECIMLKAVELLYGDIEQPQPKKKGGG